MLLTANVLEERFGSTFKDWTCPCCNDYADNIPHLFTCNSLQHIWQPLFDQLLNFLSKFANKHKLNSHCKTLLNSLLPRINTPSDNLHFIQTNFKQCLKAFINLSTV